MNSYPHCWTDLGVGVGLRSKHYQDILDQRPSIAWFEALTENYLGTEGRARRILKTISEQYPIVLHGVSLSIGSGDPINWDYLKRLKQLAADVSARWISDHLCWTGVTGVNVHDLLPLPYHEESLKHVATRLRQVQDFLEQPILIENPSSYIAYQASEMSEEEFLKELAIEADCGLLLDVNNVYVSSINHGFDPINYINTIPAEKVGQYHVAGHTVKEHFILDSHIGPVPDAVLELFCYSWKKIGPRATLLEWDEEIPDLAGLLAEADKIRQLCTEGLSMPQLIKKNERVAEL